MIEFVDNLLDGSDDIALAAFVVDVADVVDAEAAFAQRRVDVFPALLHVQDLLPLAGGMVVGVWQFQASRLVRFVTVGIRELVQVEFGEGQAVA